MGYSKPSWLKNSIETIQSKAGTEPIREAKRAIILLNFAIQTDRKIMSGKTDIAVKDYKRKNMPSN